MRIFVGILGKGGVERQWSCALTHLLPLRAPWFSLICWLCVTVYVRNKSAGSSDVGFERDGHRFRSLRRQEVTELQREA